MRIAAGETLALLLELAQGLDSVSAVPLGCGGRRRPEGAPRLFGTCQGHVVLAAQKPEGGGRLRDGGPHTQLCPRAAGMVLRREC